MTRRQKVQQIISKWNGLVTESADLLGNENPSAIFWPMVKISAHLLSRDSERMVSKASIFIRKCIHPLFVLLLPLFMERKQVFESKNGLRGLNALDEPQKFSRESVIWCPNHGFKDDVAATLRACLRKKDWFC